jgi:hypothetical protein
VAVYLIWEAILLVATAVLVGAALATTPHSNFADIVRPAGYAGLVAAWLVPGVRTTLSATRNAREPGRWAGLPAGLGALAGLTGSSLLAGAGGVSMAIYLGAGDPSSGGINLTLTSLAAVLVGGVSVFGRRAGVLGTVLGVAHVLRQQPERRRRPVRSGLTRTTPRPRDHVAGLARRR